MVKLLSRVVLLIVVFGLCLNFSAQVTSADGGNHLDAHQISWSDVSIPAQYRNKADWLLDMGKITKAEAFGPFKGKAYKVGDSDKFIALDFLGGPQRTITAHLMLVTDHAYWWFEDGVQPDQTDLEKAGSFFEKQIYPLDTSLFGNIWSPGIDGDPHVFVLHQKQLGSYAVGVFSPKDECAKTLCPDSNQHQMVYYGMNYGPVNSPLHLSVIAHEFQHLIQYNVDGGEQRWLNEGLSQLAELLNGFNPRTIADSNLRSFLEDPNFQLDSWPTRAETDPAVNYAASYIFCVYLYQRFGTPFIQHLSRSPYKGLASVEETLKAMNTGLTLDQVFTDFTITNYLDSPYVGDGQYYYQSLKLPERALTHPLNGTEQRDALNEYGAEYWQIDASGSYTLNFKADKTIPLLNNATPPGGPVMWWSYNEAQGAARLEHDFDLTKLTKADAPQLQFDAWWDILRDGSLAQVLASQDGGKTWTFLKASGSGECNNLTGTTPCYTGKSAGWQHETVDLTPYVGQKIRLRFEYLTAGFGAATGFFINKVAIPAIKYSDDLQATASDWTTQGFIRVTAALPQHWAVNVITRGDPPTVIPVPLDANNTAKMHIDVPDGGAVVVVSAMAPFVKGAANYSLSAVTN